jgi:hypothetical protein
MTGEQLLDALKVMTPAERAYPVTISAGEDCVGMEIETIGVIGAPMFTPDGDYRICHQLYLD